MHAEVETVHRELPRRHFRGVVKKPGARRTISGVEEDAEQGEARAGDQQETENGARETPVLFLFQSPQQPAVDRDERRRKAPSPSRFCNALGRAGPR